MEGNPDREYKERELEKELEVQKSIGRAKKDLPFSSEEVETLGDIYVGIVKTKDSVKYFNRMQGSEDGLKEFELWKKFQDVIGKNYTPNISYQEFMSRVLH